jgi:hypothetical protein
MAPARAVATPNLLFVQERHHDPASDWLRRAVMELLVFDRPPEGLSSVMLDIVMSIPPEADFVALP